MRILYIYCDGGFGNRYNTLISGLALAKRAFFIPKVVWPINNWCGASFDALFAQPMNVIEREFADFAEQAAQLHFFITEDTLQKNLRFVSPLAFTDLNSAFNYLAYSTRDVFFHSPLIPPYIPFANLKQQIAALEFRPEIQERANQFVLEQQLIDYFGVQIRKTDFGKHGADDDSLYQLIEQSPHKRFFVCSDDKAVEERFKRLNNVAIYEKLAHVEKRVDGNWNTPTRDFSGRVYACNVNRSAQSVIDALVDILILSRSNIVKTSNSTFLNVALLLQAAA